MLIPKERWVGGIENEEVEEDEQPGKEKRDNTNFEFFLIFSRSSARWAEPRACQIGDMEWHLVFDGGNKFTRAEQYFMRVHTRLGSLSQSFTSSLLRRSNTHEAKRALRML